MQLEVFISELVFLKLYLDLASGGLECKKTYFRSVCIIILIVGIFVPRFSVLFLTYRLCKQIIQLN